MRSSNKKILICFLLINTVFVTCPSTEDVNRCVEEISNEFNNKEPVDDFLHAFLNIYHQNYYDPEHRENIKVLYGNERLSNLEIGYYYTLLNTATKLIHENRPHILTPLDFCKTYGNKKDDCLRDILAIGSIKAVDRGSDCLEHMYRNWKEASESTPIPGTENLSDEKLLEVIYNGSNRFRNINDGDLLDVISKESDIIYTSMTFSPNENVSVEDHAFYANACEEYKRRKNTPKSYATLFALDIYDKLKQNCDCSQFKSRWQFCFGRLSDQENDSLYY